jgi:hypothetical protein
VTWSITPSTLIGTYFEIDLTTSNDRFTSSIYDRPHC